MAKEDRDVDYPEQAFKSLGLVHGTHEDLIKIFEDYQGRSIVGIQRGSDHPPLIKVLYPLFMHCSKVDKVKFPMTSISKFLNFLPIDDEVMPSEIRLKVVMMYDANKRVKSEYIKSCAKLYKSRKALEMVGDKND